ncbi:hypothetical protein PVK06_023235 [Gossypium arboreum]|uniref:RNase H type-1 domain-containing protein n=1 Tax=Gossypium arboreum TaxID=29729 RepID=A0ABR0PAI3_GOSAR|nr:hypothetical protein PVK06_023235 [Gossypium arboreum]
MLQRHQAATSPFSLVRGIKQFCAQTMQVEIRQIPREANQIANMMAKLAGNGQHELLVYNSAPLAVLHLLGSPRYLPLLYLENYLEVKGFVGIGAPLEGRIGAKYIHLDGQLASRID